MIKFPPKLAILNSISVSFVISGLFCACKSFSANESLNNILEHICSMPWKDGRARIKHCHNITYSILSLCAHILLFIWIVVTSII